MIIKEAKLNRSINWIKHFIENLQIEDSILHRENAFSKTIKWIITNK